MLGAQTQLLARYLDLLSLRQRVTAANIANADTPGYRTRDIDFRLELARALAAGAPPAAGAVAIRETGGRAVKNDGNDVSVERELQVLAESGIRFNLAAMLVRGNIRAVRAAIQEGRF